jgi:hypothetical protein
VHNIKESCDRHNQTLPSTWNCYDVNLTFSLPFGGTMDALVVQQAALGYVETILQQYNLENLDEAFVEYRYPKFVEAAMTVYAVGLTHAVMSNAERQLFLKVYRQGFDAVLASKASAVPMAVYDAEILYQVPPLAAADGDSTSSTASDESIRARLDANSTNSTTTTTTITPVETSSSDAVPLTSNVAVRMLVRATCAGSECHDGLLATALWEKVPPHADAWSAGVREQAAKSSNMALRNYFAPLDTIVFESPTSSSYHSNASGIPGDNSGVYHPLSEVDGAQGVPTWIWIVVGVDAGILLVALLVACCRVAKRRKEWAGMDTNHQNKSNKSNDPEEPIPEQYPHEPYPNMAGLKEAAGSTHRDASGNDIGDEFHDEGSDRIFDDGIRVREGQVEPGDENDEFHDDGSDRIFDDGIRVREVQVDPDELLAGHGAPRAPPPQRPPPPPPPSSPTPPHEDLPYDDGVRVSVENAGQTSRVHDDGIHISNSIQDID